MAALSIVQSEKAFCRFSMALVFVSEKETTTILQNGAREAQFLLKLPLPEEKHWAFTNPSFLPHWEQIIVRVSKQ